MELTRKEYENLYGRAVTATSILLYLAIVAIGAGIVKILTSKRGKVSYGGIQISWGN